MTGIVLAMCLASALAPAVENDAAGQVVRMPPIGDHWLFVPDRLLQHSLLFDGDSGEVVGTISSPGALTPKLPLVSRSRGEIYSVDVDYARGTRGARTDYVTVYDAATLDVATDIVLPHPTSSSNTSLHHAALLDGDRFLAIFSHFPATLVMIVDLELRKVVGEVPIAGCAGVYATGPRSFATLCGDGSTYHVGLDAGGRPAATGRSAPFFDVVDDPVSMAGVRDGARWTFVSFAGRVHTIDYAVSTTPDGDAEAAWDPRALPAWFLADEETRAAGWRPGGLQPHALHRASGRLFVLMHEGGSGTHKDASPEIWRFDLEGHTRTARFVIPNLALDFLGPLLGLPSEGFGRTLLDWVVPNEGAHSIAISQDAAPLLFTRNAELGVVGVLDPESGEALRSLGEAGFAGPTLGVLE